MHPRKEGAPANQFPCADRVSKLTDSHACQTPWSVFQDGSNGEPTGRCLERTSANGWNADGARRILDHTGNMPRAHTMRPGLDHQHSPQRSVSQAEQRTNKSHSASDRSTPSTPIRFPRGNFKYSLTLFSKSFSSFPRGTCSLSVSRQYLALDKIYRPIGAAFPNNPTRRQCLVMRHGPSQTGLSPSPAPHSKGLGPDPSLRTPLQTTTRTDSTVKFSSWADPGSLAVTRGILVSFFSSAYLYA